jgi:hypothetical protein
MPLYYFVLKNIGQTIPDRDGVELPDDGAAREYAVAVARDLMKARQIKTRSWRVEVRDEYLMPRFDVLFASVDDSLTHLAPEFRASIQIVCHRSAMLYDSIDEVRRTLEQVRATLGQADQVLMSR